MASTQEGLFTIQKRKRNATILKIDLQKAYDCLDWGFLRCLLVKISLNNGITNWIMACVEMVNFLVIINGIPSPFFSASRGLRQGCPLSPLLFILAMNTLSLHINKAVEESRAFPLKVCRGISISHNLFVDDIILFGMLCKISWACFFVILDNFQKATGLKINSEKSAFFHNSLS